jgi:cysteine desulfurase
MRMNDYIYLDYGATTPLDPRVLDAMLPWLTQSFANPSSLYAPARLARSAIEDARAEVAELLGARASEIVFTSGGTESVNSALRGIAMAQVRSRVGRQIITSTIEHQAVLHTCEYLENFGCDVTYIDVDDHAFVNVDDMLRALGERTALISVMLVNNEVGTIQPVREIAELARERGAKIGKRVLVHSDAIAAAGQLPLNVGQLEVDALSLAAHKFGGPKGAGILYLRRGVPFLAQQTGGGQEHQRRAGTEHVAGIVGTAIALRLATQALPAEAARLRLLRDRLIDGILRTIPNSALNGDPRQRLAGNVNVRLPGVNGEELLAELDRSGIAASSGSACADASWEPSHVVLAMGFTLAEAGASVRFSLGSATTGDEIDRVLAALPPIVQRLRRSEQTISVAS